jgi:uncharacterized protein DUF3592
MNLIIIGILFLIFPFLPPIRLMGLLKRGERCEGFIHRLDYKNPNDPESQAKDKITVRFTTKNQELITTDLNTNFILFFGLLKEGEKVPVIYNPENPEQFNLEKLPTDILIKATCILIGLICVVFGIN